MSKEVCNRFKQGQIFQSKSKVQSEFKTYRYDGIFPHLGHSCYDIKLTDTETNEYFFVEPEWFNQRIIKEISNVKSA